MYKPKHNSKEEVIAALRELMHLGPNDPAPQPPPLPAATDKKDDKKSDDKKVTKTRAERTKSPLQRQSPKRAMRKIANHNGFGLASE